MTYNPDINHRRSIRLREYDYSSVGAYFVTICTQGRECLFGDVADGEMCPNDAGRMVGEWWAKLPEKFPHVEVDESVVMPDHFHGIIILTDRAMDFACRGDTLCSPAVDCKGDTLCSPAVDCVDPPVKVPNGTMENSLGRVIQAFKSLTSVEYVRGVKECNWPPFSGRLWQRNYYERVIRVDAELFGIREYIHFNPAKWADDDEYSTK